MTDDVRFPLIEAHLPEMMEFISGLVPDYQSGSIPSWEKMAERVRRFFTPEMLDKVDSVIPGWQKMSTFSDGVTLIHVLCVFTGLITSLEFQQASAAQQALMKWIVLFHDIAKEVRPGQRDQTHSFRSAATAGRVLPRLGFPIMTEYDTLFPEWFKLVNQAITRASETAGPIRDTLQLPPIIAGIERLFGHHTPTALIVKTVLLHDSINVVAEWPQAAPLTEDEIRNYLDTALFPLLKMMMLADSDGWTLFDPPTREQYRQETRAVYDQLAFRLVV